MIIRIAHDGDVMTAAALAKQLWPHHTLVELEEEMRDYMAEDACILLAEREGEAVGFAQCGLRRDYVEGTDSRPVGYLEGIFVEAPYRRRGIAAALVSACEQWAKARGCSQFASDCELDNELSIAFHNHVGFAEANRIVCFVKDIL